MSQGKYGLSTEEHNKLNVDAFNARVYDRVKYHKGGFIADVFSGGPRDILNLYDAVEGDGIFFASDAMDGKIQDLVGKNFDVAARQARGLIIPDFKLRTAEEPSVIAGEDVIHVVQHRFPASKTGVEFPSHSKFNFTLCNAGIMFVQPEDLHDSLSEMAGMVAKGGELVIRFSQARDDMLDNLNKSYFMHDVDHVREVLEDAGLLTQRFDDLDDPKGRGFSWVDIGAVRPPNGWE